MIKRFNYKRKRNITRDMYEFEVEKLDNDYHLKINKLDLSSLDYDADYEVKILVWVTQGVKKKIELGTFGNVEMNPVKEHARLPFIREGITHKVKGELFVVDPLNAYIKKTTSAEIIIKEFDILQAKGSLLPVQYYDLNERPWNVQINENDEFPILQLNDRFRECELIEYLKGKGKLVQSLIIYPAFREILQHIVMVEGKNSPQNCDQEWMKEWLEFALKVDSSRIPQFDANNPNYEEIQEWINSVSESLSRRGDFIEAIKRDILGSIGG
jgi:hypothetical protein